ncbi:iron ABC transporter permease [Aquisalimonas lutea]|uniref:FecCD family ABC transporter permease n=1 Tax=Aquisalimonas lutea TaxID=1327750 RepID=UPI0025B42B03|nr:iron ABC transporter permease [Aquisalimonas lutea]MDN3519526.1 iron ABC transporter permease [Aquisalimonas lutea]
MTATGRAAGRWRLLLAGYVLPVLAILGLVALAFNLGRYPVAPGQALAILYAAATGTEHGLPATLETVVMDVRLPRIGAALVVGAALAAAGATYQGIFRNPLVSPDILGVSSGAAFGAALAIFLALPFLFVQGLAFVFGLVAVSAVYLIATLVRGAHNPLLVLVLAGVVVGSLLSAAVSMLKYLADPYDQLPAIEYWLLGSLSAARAGDVLGILVPVALGLIPLVLVRWRINLLSLDEEEARALGVNTGRLRVVVIAAATLITASAISIAGTVGWVGLIIPHLARMLVGPNYIRLLPASILVGAGYLLAVDTVARNAAAIELPLGTLNAFLGAPFFLYLLARARRSWT